MASIEQSHAHLMPSDKEAPNQFGLFSSESVLKILQLILAGAPLEEVLSIIAQLVESRGDGTLCTIWLPKDYERQLYCAAAPSLPGFITHVGSMLIGPKGGSCGTAVYRREPVYVTDILNDPVWDHYRHRLLPFGIRAVWSRPLFTSDGKVLATFAIHYLSLQRPSSHQQQRRCAQPDHSNPQISRRRNRNSHAGHRCNISSNAHRALRDQHQQRSGQ